MWNPHVGVGQVGGGRVFETPMLEWDGEGLRVCETSMLAWDMGREWGSVKPPGWSRTGGRDGGL